MFWVVDILDVLGTRVPERCAVHGPSAAARVSVLQATLTGDLLLGTSPKVGGHRPSRFKTRSAATAARHAAPALSRPHPPHSRCPRPCPRLLRRQRTSVLWRCRRHCRGHQHPHPATPRALEGTHRRPARDTGVGASDHHVRTRMSRAACSHMSTGMAGTTSCMSGSECSSPPRPWATPSSKRPRYATRWTSMPSTTAASPSCPCPEMMRSSRCPTSSSLPS